MNKYTVVTVQHCDEGHEHEFTSTLFAENGQDAIASATSLHVMNDVLGIPLDSINITDETKVDHVQEDDELIYTVASVTII